MNITLIGAISNRSICFEMIKGITPIDISTMKIFAKRKGDRYCSWYYVRGSSAEIHNMRDAALNKEMVELPL